MGRFKRLGKNTALIFLGTASSKLITFIMLPLYTRWLNTDQYGAVDLVTTYSTLFLGIVSLSIFDSIFIFPKGKNTIQKSKYFSSCMIFGGATSVVSLLFCWGLLRLSSFFGWHGFIIDYIWQIDLLLISTYIQQLIQQFIRAIDKMNVYAFTGLIQTLGTVVVSFYIIPRYKVNGYVWALIFGNLTGIVYSLYVSKAYKFLSIKYWNLKYLFQMLKYSIPIIPNGIMWFFVNSINRPLLEDYHGLATVGLLAVANKIPTIINQVYMIFHRAFTISALEESTTTTYHQFYNQSLKLVVIIQILLISVIAITSKFIIQVFTGPEFFDSWKYIPILAYGVLFTNIATFVGTNFTINKKSKYYFYSTVWAGLSALLLNVLLIPKFAIWGACFALVLSQMIGMLARIKYSWSVVTISNWNFYIWNFILIAFLVIFQVLSIPTSFKIIISLFILLVFYLKNRFYINGSIILLLKEVRKKYN